uniref:Serine/threonine-protein kinase receptor n=1 Tax=Plectus sambesii TaxID=2011161 RepID=A0A914UXN4_9BILA
ANTLTVSQALCIVTSMMNGLAFLHEESKSSIDGDIYKPTIVHRDFKSRNVLLQKGLIACIADFGLAMRCENGRTPADDHGQVGTRRYMSPEVLEGATEFSALAFRAIDIYAAALVIWEVLSRIRIDPDVPLPEYKLPYEAEVGAHPTLGEMRETVAVRKLRPITPAAVRAHKVGAVMCKTMEEMWEMEPDGRITAGCCLERMMAIAKT